MNIAAKTNEALLLRCLIYIDIYELSDKAFRNNADKATLQLNSSVVKQYYITELYK